jgi:hypothetical protein
MSNESLSWEISNFDYKRIKAYSTFIQLYLFVYQYIYYLCKGFVANVR